MSAKETNRRNFSIISILLIHRSCHIWLNRLNLCPSLSDRYRIRFFKIGWCPLEVSCITSRLILRLYFWLNFGGYRSLDYYSIWIRAASLRFRSICIDVRNTRISFSKIDGNTQKLIGKEITEDLI